METENTKTLLRFPSFWLPKTENSEIFLKTTKIWTGRKTESFRYDLEEKLKTFKISKFYILLYTQDWKLGNFGNLTFNSDFDSNLNSVFEKKKKKWMERKTKMLQYSLRKKNEHFQGVWVSDFAL